MIILISILTLIITVLGGLFAFRYRDRMHLVLGFSAGAIIGVAFFELLPESIELTAQNFEAHVVSAVIALGFMLFLLADRAFGSHVHDVDNEKCLNTNHNGSVGATGLALHSFIDGLAIGLAFKIDVAIGLAVSVAVLAHKFFDGINAVSVVLRDGNGSKLRALKWLIITAVAPVVGIISASFFTVSDSVLGLLLAVFCGFFIYIGASDLLPESHHGHKTHWTTFATVLGMVLIYIIIEISHG